MRLKGNTLRTEGYMGASCVRRPPQKKEKKEQNTFALRFPLNIAQKKRYPQTRHPHIGKQNEDQSSLRPSQPFRRSQSRTVFAAALCLGRGMDPSASTRRFPDRKFRASQVSGRSQADVADLVRTHLGGDFCAFLGTPTLQCLGVLRVGGRKISEPFEVMR